MGDQGGKTYETANIQYSVLSSQYSVLWCSFKFAQSDKIYSLKVVKGCKGRIALGSIGTKRIRVKAKAKENRKKSKLGTEIERIEYIIKGCIRVQTDTPQTYTC